MPAAIRLTIEQIKHAMSRTMSNKAAARYLGIDYHTYRKYTKLYDDPETGKSLFEIHLNPQGKGIPKYLTPSIKKGEELPPLQRILNGEVEILSSFSVDKLKAKLLHESVFLEECSHCGFKERRIMDNKVPLLLNFKDKNKKNWKRDNLEFLCYNCYFLHIGNVWNEEQLKQLEDYTKINPREEEVKWDLDQHHIEHLKELGLWEDEHPENEYISRI